MLVKKIILPIVSFTLIVMMILCSLQLAQAPKLEEIRAALKYKVKIVSENFSDFINPARKPPLTTIALEENMKMHLPIPFAEFTFRDWKWFWHLLYGSFEEDSRSWPRRKKQLTRYQIQEILAERYYMPFGHFQEQQWKIFWKTVLKGKVFKD